MTAPHTTKEDAPDGHVWIIPQEPITPIADLIAAARLEGAKAMQEAAASAIMANGKATCASCGKPRDNHPYRHPFQGLAPDYLTAIRAIDPAEVLK